MDTAATAEVSGDAAPKADHLCVLVHGLWGRPSDLNYMQSVLRKAYGEDELCILVAKRNAGSFTYDGVEVGAERVTREIEDELEELAHRGYNIKKLSVVGYSLGGLVARYAIGLLYSKGYFERLEPVNFTTFASPYLGVRSPLSGLYYRTWNAVGTRTWFSSGRQLFMTDSFRNTGRPLLSILADPDSIFIHALARFKNRCLYANIVNDRAATFYTTSISTVDPFADLEKIKVDYGKGYEPVIIDSCAPIERQRCDELNATKHRFCEELAIQWPRIALVLLIPVALIVFVVSSSFQSIMSKKRIRLHESGRYAAIFGSYYIPVLVKAVQTSMEGSYENIEADDAGVTDLSEKDASEDEIEETKLDRMSTLIDSPSDDWEATTDFPVLALTNDQFNMIQTLNKVGFRKHFVHIHKTYHSHAAMIVRMPWRESMHEGEIVLRHWLEQEFEI